MKEAVCSADKELLDITKCEVEVDGDKTGVLTSGIFITSITSFGLEALLFTKRQNEMKRLLHFSDVDVCDMINTGKTSAPIIRVIRDAIDSGGNIPKKCPIANGYKFEFHDLNVDPKFFPFLPEMKFLIVLNFALNDVPRNYVMNITGEIVNRRKTKSW